MPAHYFDSFTSVGQFKGPNVRRISQLPMAPASGWRRDHLLVCRVTVRQTRPYILPILDQYSESSGATSPVEIRNFVNGPESGKHLQKIEHRLVRDFGYSISLAQTWAALAAFKGDRDAQRTHQSNGPSNSNDGSHYEESNADSDVSMDTESDGDSKARSTRARRARQETPDETTSHLSPLEQCKLLLAVPRLRALTAHRQLVTLKTQNINSELRSKMTLCDLRHVSFDIFCISGHLKTSPICRALSNFGTPSYEASNFPDCWKSL